MREIGRVEGAHQQFYRNRPPLVRQGGHLTCWAAALESWLAVAYPASRVPEAEIVQSTACWQGADGRLNWVSLPALGRCFGMDCEEVGPGALAPEYLCERLRRGHLYLSYMPTPGIVSGHTVVLYGVGPVSADLMDPLEGYTSKPLEFFASRTRAVVGWPARQGALLGIRGAMASKLPLNRRV